MVWGYDVSVQTVVGQSRKNCQGSRCLAPHSSTGTKLKLEALRVWRIEPSSFSLNIAFRCDYALKERICWLLKPEVSYGRWSCESDIIRTGIMRLFVEEMMNHGILRRISP